MILRHLNLHISFNSDPWPLIWSLTLYIKLPTFGFWPRISHPWHLTFDICFVIFIFHLWALNSDLWSLTIDHLINDLWTFIFNLWPLVSDIELLTLDLWSLIGDYWPLNFYILSLIFTFNFWPLTFESQFINIEFWGLTSHHWVLTSRF